MELLEKVKERLDITDTSQDKKYKVILMILQIK